jgi:hypothetical protein
MAVRGSDCVSRSANLRRETKATIRAKLRIEHANTFEDGVGGATAPRWQANLDIVWQFDPVTVNL